MSMPRPPEQAHDDDQPLFDVPDSAIVPKTGLRAFFRGYQGTQRTRLHVLRDTPVNRYSTPRAGFNGDEGWCGTSAAPTYQSATLWIDPLPRHPPDGLVWCPTCVGRLAERLGLLDQVAELLAAAA